jgi:hypothetical protein
VLVKKRLHLFRELVNGELVYRAVYQKTPATAGDKQQTGSKRKTRGAKRFHEAAICAKVQEKQQGCERHKKRQPFLVLPFFVSQYMPY